MPFLLLVFAWAAFIAALFALLEVWRHYADFKRAFLAYFLVAANLTFGWFLVVFLLRLGLPDTVPFQLYMVAPALPLVAGFVQAMFRSAAEKPLK